LVFELSSVRSAMFIVTISDSSSSPVGA